MTTKFSINNNDPYFGSFTFTNPKDKGKECCSYSPTYTYFCSECEALRAALSQERSAHAKDNIENSRVGDHLRSQLAKTKNELAEVEKMHAAQAKTIIEKNEQISKLKERNLDPEPHALKAAVLVMQKQLDELTAALAKAKAENEFANEDWSRCYHNMLSSYQKALSEAGKRYHTNLETIQNLERKLSEVEASNDNDCGCDEWEGCDCKSVDELAAENSDKQRQIEQQNGIIGAKQEEINNLKVALNKAKAKQTFEIKPAAEIVRAYEDKIRRLLNIVASKEEIITGLQNDLRNDRES